MGNLGRNDHVGRGGRRARNVLVVVSMIILFSGCNSRSLASQASPGVAALRLPVFEKSCAPQSGSPAIVPIRIVGTAIVANVCIGGEGPFPFLVDTGAAASLVDSSLAARLHLDLVDGPRRVLSFTCQRQVSFAVISRWSVGGTTLLRQTVQVGGVRSPALPNLDGVLGSDVLSSFGAVRIDYDQQTLTFGPQGAPPGSDVAGRSGAPSVMSSITEGTSFAAEMPVTVTRQSLSPDHLQLVEVKPTVDLSLGSDQLIVTLDTGTGATVGLDPSEVTKLGLVPVGASGTAYAGLDCPVQVSHYTLGPAMLGNVELPAQRVISNALPANGTVGVLGSGTLIHHSPVVVDYTAGELFLGQNNQATAPLNH